LLDGAGCYEQPWQLWRLVWHQLAVMWLRLCMLPASVAEEDTFSIASRIGGSHSLADLMSDELMIGGTSDSDDHAS
jgi:hypothetical protein